MRPTLKVTSYQNTTKKRDVNTNVQPEDFQKIAEEILVRYQEFSKVSSGYDTKIMIHKRKKKKGEAGLHRI